MHNNMTKKELADLIGISRNTLYVWEKEKPELIRLINLGLMADKIINQTKQLAKEMEEIEEKAKSGKIQLK